MAYSFDPIFAADPNNPSTVAANASIVIFDPNDPGKAPVTITDPTGSPIPNPVTVNKNGFGTAFQHATLDRVGWSGGGFEGYFTSYEGLKQVAVEAQAAAETAAADASAAATADLEARIAAGEFKGEKGADGANVLPTNDAVANAITAEGPTKTALSATIATATTGKLDRTEAASKYVPSAPVRSTAFGGGRLWAFPGDSITNGSSSTNTSLDSYRVLVGNFVGTHKVRKSSINAGVPGDTSTQLLARVDGIIAQGPEAAFVLIGTNDANQLVPLATFQANVVAIAAKFRAAGIPVAFGTVPPRVSSASAAIHTLIGQYNMWLRLWAPRNGIKLAAVHAALTDPATGYFAASMANADGIHPNDAGHIAIAKAAANVVNEMVIDEPWPVDAPQPGVGMLTNPLMAGTTTATAWAINPGIGSGPAGVQGVAAPVNGDLPYGQWSTLRMDGTTTAGSRYLLAPATGFAAGDKLLVCAYLKSSHPDGAGLTVAVLNSSTGATVVPPVASFLKTGTPGPVMVPFTMPDPAPAAASLRIGIGQVVTAGQDITAYVGAMQVYNLTQLGLADIA